MGEVDFLAAAVEAVAAEADKGFRSICSSGIYWGILRHMNVS